MIIKQAHLPMLTLITLFSTAPVQAQDLIQDWQSTNSSRFQVFQAVEEPQNSKLVKPQIGLSAMLKEITTKLSAAQKQGTLDNSTADEFQRLAGNIADQIKLVKTDTQGSQSVEARKQLLKYAKELFGLAQEINSRIKGSYTTAFCEDGNCLSRTPEALCNQAKELQARIRERLACGIISGATAKDYKQAVQKQYRLGIDSYREGSGIESSSLTLNRLEQRLDREGIVGFQPRRGQEIATQE